MGVLSGFCPRARFRRIAPATCTNDLPPETAANCSAPIACGPNVDQARRSRGQRRAASRTLPSKADPRRLPPASEPRHGNRLARGALAGSGPGTSPCIDGLSLVTGMVVSKRPSSKTSRSLWRRSWMLGVWGGGIRTRPARPTRYRRVQRCAPDLHPCHRRVLGRPGVCAPSVSKR
jgi:hypothetical protein